MKVQKNGSGELLVRLPDRLQALIRTDDGRDYELFYNGQTITLYSPKENYYATAPAPPTVARMLDAIQARYGIVLPLADFIHMAAAEDLYQNITAAGHVGVSRIDGVECDHLAVRQPNVDWQVWIEKTNTPVPRKIVITTKKQPTQPQYESTLKWDLTPEIDGDVFTFDIPPDAARIKFAVRNQK
jgi:hypothetical protein